MKKILILLIISFFFFSGFGSPRLKAETMQSSSYQIQFGNFNVTSGEKSSTSYTLTDTVGQISPGQYDGSGYVVKAGFQYIYPFNQTSLRISKLTIDLGELTPNQFSTNTHTLTVSNQGAGGYVVTAQESHPLRIQSGSATIPDTTCDAGTCDESAASTWTNPSNYGFGFNLSGDDVESDFSTLNHFRQFANLASAETPQTIMSGSGVALNRESTVTYKVSISGSQQAGLYETLVTYNLLPTY